MIGFSDIEDSDVSDDQEIQQIQQIPVVKRETPIQRVENTVVKVQPTELNVPIIQEPQRVILHKKHREIVQEEEELQIELDDFDSIQAPEEEYEVVQEDPPEPIKEQQPQIPQNFLNLQNYINQDFEEEKQVLYEKDPPIMEQEQTPNQAITYNKSDQFLNTKACPKNRFYNPKSSNIYKKYISKEYCDFDDVIHNELQEDSQQAVEEPDPLLEGLENVIQQLMLPPKKIKSFENRLRKVEENIQKRRQAPQQRSRTKQKNGSEKSEIQSSEQMILEKPVKEKNPKLTAEEQKKKQQEDRLLRQAQLEEQKKKNRMNQEKKVLQILDKKIYEQGLIKYKCVVQEKSKETTQYLRWSELALIYEGSNKVMEFELQTREKHLHYLLKDITSCFTQHKIVNGVNQGAQNIHVDQDEEYIKTKGSRFNKDFKERKKRTRTKKDEESQSSNIKQENIVPQEKSQEEVGKNETKVKLDEMPKQQNKQEKQNQKQPVQVQKQQQIIIKQQNQQEKYKRRRIIESSDDEEEKQKDMGNTKNIQQEEFKQSQDQKQQKQQKENSVIKQNNEVRKNDQIKSNINQDQDLFDADAVNIFYLKNQREKRIDKRKPTVVGEQPTKQINKPSNKQKSIQIDNDETRRTRMQSNKRHTKQEGLKSKQLNSDEDDSREEIRTRKVKKSQKKSLRELSVSSDENIRNSRKKIKK